MEKDEQQGKAKSPSELHRDHRSRMRERYYATGLDGFSDHEALEMLLYNTIARRDTNLIAHNLIEYFGSFSAVLDAAPEDLRGVPMVGEQTAAFLSSLPDFFRRYQIDRHGARPKLQTQKAAGAYVCSLFIGKQVEEFYLICLDYHYAVIRTVRISVGTVISTQVDTQEVVRVALRCHASYALFCHNHPSGSLQPSLDDVDLTDNLVEKLTQVGIGVLDHLLVYGNEYGSMRDQGFIRCSPSIMSRATQKNKDGSTGGNNDADERK